MESASRTALGAAMHRAAHQLLDSPPVFLDPLALRIIGPGAERTLKGGERGRFTSPGLRALVVVRSRFAEDGLAEAHDRGVGQYVLLGAGLDTYAYRSRRPGLKVFEVDHPSTQAWKRGRLMAARIAIPDTVAYAAVDFERQSIASGLAAAGFDVARPAFISWLGVTPYLSNDAVQETLRFVASLAKGSELVFDYVSSAPDAAAASDRSHQALAARVAAIGEPFRSAYPPGVLTADLERLGFSAIEDFGPEALNLRYFSGRTDSLRLVGRGHLMRAR
jgi:methyltransferase (TIGR00027 family)